MPRPRSASDRGPIHEVHYHVQVNGNNNRVEIPAIHAQSSRRGLLPFVLGVLKLLPVVGSFISDRQQRP